VVLVLVLLLLLLLLVVLVLVLDLVLEVWEFVSVLVSGVGADADAEADFVLTHGRWQPCCRSWVRGFGVPSEAWQFTNDEGTQWVSNMFEK
jgi:hypothetical protein